VRGHHHKVNRLGVGVIEDLAICFAVNVFTNNGKTRRLGAVSQFVQAVNIYLHEGAWGLGGGAGGRIFFFRQAVIIAKNIKQVQVCIPMVTDLNGICKGIIGAG